LEDTTQSPVNTEAQRPKLSIGEFASIFLHELIRWNLLNCYWAFYKSFALLFTANISEGVVNSKSNFKMAPTTRAQFESVFPKLVEDIIAVPKAYNMPENAVKWFEAVGFAHEATCINC
jgi:hypothetical protein